MDSGAPVNLKKSVCRRMTAAAMRRAQVKMVLVLELVAIRNCFTDGRARQSSSAPARKKAAQLFASTMQHDPEVCFGNFHAAADFPARILVHFIHRERLRNPRRQQTECRFQ